MARAKYPGVCSICQNRFKVGTNVYFDNGSVSHFKCWNEQKEEVNKPVSQVPPNAEQTLQDATSGVLQPTQAPDPIQVALDAGSQFLQAHKEVPVKIEPEYLIDPETCCRGLCPGVWFKSKNPQATIDYIMKYYPYLKLKLDPSGRNLDDVLEETKTLVIYGKE